MLAPSANRLGRFSSSPATHRLPIGKVVEQLRPRNVASISVNGNTQTFPPDTSALHQILAASASNRVLGEMPEVGTAPKPNLTYVATNRRKQSPITRTGTSGVRVVGPFGGSSCAPPKSKL